MNLIGINETIRAVAWPTDDDLKRVIDRTHALGGIVLMNHLPWSRDPEGDFGIARMQNHPTLDQLKSWGVDAFDILSPEGVDFQTYEWVVNNSRLPLSGTDIHHKNEPASCWTFLSIPGTNDTSTKGINTSLGRVGAEQVMQALRNHSTNPAFASNIRAPLYFDIAADASTKTNTNNLRTWMPWFAFGDTLVDTLVDRAAGMWSFVDVTCHNASSVGPPDGTAGWIDPRPGHARDWRWQWISFWMWLLALFLIVMWIIFIDWGCNTLVAKFISWRANQ